MQRLLLCAVLVLMPGQAFAQLSGTVMPTPRQGFMDAEGDDPCNGCKLYHYAAGTSTLRDVYIDVSLTTAHAQPVVLNSSGRPQNSGTETTIYLQQGLSYRFALFSANDVQIWDQDNVIAMPSASGNIDLTGTAGEALAAGDVVYLSDGSGSLTAGRWYKADADNTYSSTTAPFVGVAAATISSAASGTIRVAGRVTGLSGLTGGELYYVSATAAAMTATPPANARFIGAADSTTTLVVGAHPGDLRTPDSDGTHHLVLKTTSNLTADRLFTLVPGDAARTLTISTDVTLDQNLSTTSAPSFSWSGIAEGRLTLTTAVPVTTSDVTAATTIYYTPYRGNRIAVYTGSAWTIRTFSEMSITAAGGEFTVTSRVYDLFFDYNDGTPVLRAHPWTNDTTRATALIMQDGVLVKTGDTQQRYIGSVYKNASDQFTDSVLLRHLWNKDNRVLRQVRATEDADSWAYATASYRQMNGDTANQIEVLVGLAEEAIDLTGAGLMTDASSGSTLAAVAIGEDSVTTRHTSCIGGGGSAPATASAEFVPLTVRLTTIPAVGRHYYAALEYGHTNATFYGDNGGAVILNGIAGHWRS